MPAGLAAVMLLAVAGCRSGDAGAPALDPASAASASAGREAARADEQGAAPPIASAAEVGAAEAGAAEASAPGQAGPAPDPVPAPAVVPIVLPFPPQALVIRPLGDVPPVALFRDEGDAVRRRVAKALVARGYEVVPVAELERIEHAAAEGRLVLEGDVVCRAPLLPEEVVARYFADRPFATVEAGCFDACQLKVDVQDPARPEAYEGYASARVAKPHDPAAWLAVAGRLHASGVWGMVGLGMIGMSHPPPVRFEFPSGVGPWGSSSIQEVSFEAAEQQAAGCAHPDPAVGFRTTVRASVDAKGRVARCEATREHAMARPGDGACLCGALERLALPAGRAGRRFRVTAVDEGGSSISDLVLEAVQPGTETWRRRLADSTALARCPAVEVPSGFTALATLALAPDGTVDDVRIDGDITTPPTIALARCLVQALRLVPLPCRPPGLEALQVRLRRP